MMRGLLLSCKLCIVVIFSSLLACSCSNISGDGLETEIKKINQKCPRMVDEETQLLKVELLNETGIAYHYVLVNVYRQNVDTQEFRKQLWPGILSAFRTSPELQDFREKQAPFEYRYYDRNKDLIYAFKIGPEQYQP